MLIDELRLTQARIEIGAKLSGVTDVTVMPYRRPSCLHEITQTVDATRRIDCRKCSVLRSCESIICFLVPIFKIADCLQSVNVFLDHPTPDETALFSGGRALRQGPGAGIAWPDPRLAPQIDIAG